MVAHFFCVKKTSLSAALFGCFRRVRIIWCVNSRLKSSLLAWFRETRDAKKTKKKEEEEDFAFCGGDSRRVLLFEPREKKKLLLFYIERGEISLRDE